LGGAGRLDLVEGLGEARIVAGLDVDGVAAGELAVEGDSDLATGRLVLFDETFLGSRQIDDPTHQR
jgi:hypothetical protein